MTRGIDRLLDYKLLLRALTALKAYIDVLIYRDNSLRDSNIIYLQRLGYSGDV